MIPRARQIASFPPNGARNLSINPGQSTTHAVIQRLKHPQRGGQNLSNRYNRLEKTLRGKEALYRGIDTLIAQTQTPEKNLLKERGIKRHETYRGFRIPEPPKPPGDDECCMSGCAVCVYDLYEESLHAYRDSVAALRSSLTALNIPSGDWPESIRGNEPILDKSPILSAFQEMEKALRAKRESAERLISKPAAQTDPAYRPEKNKQKTFSIDDLFETLRWIIFSNR